MAIGVERIAAAAGVVKDCENCAHGDCQNGDGDSMPCGGTPCAGYVRKGRCGGWSPNDDTIDAALAVLAPLKEE